MNSVRTDLRFRSAPEVELGAQQPLVVPESEALVDVVTECVRASAASPSLTSSTVEPAGPFSKIRSRAAAALALPSEGSHDRVNTLLRLGL